MTAGKPEPSRGDGGGTAGVPVSERQAAAACDGYTDEQDAMTIEEVLRRENMLRAYQRVKRNKGSAGVDGMTVDELMPYLRTHWARIRDEIRRVISATAGISWWRFRSQEAGGCGVWGIPTVVDR
jgi:retron-type reverse transcriptase